MRPQKHQSLRSVILNGSMQACITATVLGLAAKIEREFISQRTKNPSSQKSQRDESRRAEGTAKTHKLDKHKKKIEEYLAKGLSLTAISKLIDELRSTINDYIKWNNL